MIKMKDVEELIKEIIECAKTVRSSLTPGFEEKIFKNAMYIEMRDRGISVETEVPFRVQYKGHIVGEYRADMIAERSVIIELKAINALATIHEVQLVNYLTATGIDNGLLINFGADVIEIRRKYRKYPKSF